MKKKKQTPRLRRWILIGIFLLIALIVIGTLGYGWAMSRIVHVRRETVYLEDLPPEFDGKTLLFISDIDMCGLSGPGGASSLLKRLERLGPDVLLLGGDYASESLSDAVNHTRNDARMEKHRRKFFASLADFDAPLGKFAVSGENDAYAADLAGEMAAGGVQLLSDSSAYLKIGGSTLYLVGFKDYYDQNKADYGGISSKVGNGDCVVAMCHNPATVSAILTGDAANTGQWCDLVLCGHTHGGQMVIGDRRLLSLSPDELRYPLGWSKQIGAHLLVSCGAGCDTVNLRAGTQAEVHFITLRRGVSLDLSDS